ncbi:DUF1553 domain-containing protein [Rubripirellula reticaptiva]|uniref:Bacterial Ig-like domain (Group 2) n=1 Tax=Rubripirellula reticaptiva TaxID=2528013 RepID=A0A5C6F7H4_9BACT|nr:DUF1553 domain-containing protein [Rubripirellula reticaptiva]TWU57663.1 hypothetical protein Poly59_05700 [Rubripirellula reticaptiva]
MKHSSLDRCAVLQFDALARALFSSAALISTLIIAMSNVNAEAAEIDFDTEIVPLLSKAGCNAASCHGGAAGQAGFRLSLFGGDPEFDYRTIVRELSGRRANLARPADSLILSKPTAQLEHGGGQVLEPDGEPAETIEHWIATGARRRQLRNLEHLRVTPTDFVADSVPATVSIQVTAFFDDGLQRDVTAQAVYVSQNESAVTVDDFGIATVTAPGRHWATVQFAGQVATVSFTTPMGSEKFTLPSSATNNWIDEQINTTLRQLRIAPANPTSDSAFLRRLSLDLTGRLPSPTQIERFVDDEADDDDWPAKRSRMIDDLLDSESFVDYWTHRLAIQLRLRKPGTDEVAADVFYDWLRDRVGDDTGWDEIAKSLILAEGDTHQNGAATVHRFFATAREEAEYISEVLMGVRLRCANCHNHPLDQWTQDDYHGLAAIFAGFERNQHVRFTGRGTVIHPRTGSDALPRIPGGHFLPPNADNRHEFSRWLTDKDNSYFARAMVGRVWQSLMGRGLIHPVDDLRATNPASHPGLLDQLTRFFAENDFKLRPLIRLICNSAAYQRSSAAPATGPTDDTMQFYARAIVKPLDAEVLADAISDVTGVPENFNGVNRAINVVDRASTSDSLQFLGLCLPGENCSTPSSSGRGIASKLHLMNGDLLNAKIIDNDGRLQKMISKKMATSEIVRELYVHALCRVPSDRELTQWIERIDASANANTQEQEAEAEQRHQRSEDFFWALLNCHEFTHSH